ncbi:MAG: peptidase C11 [Acidobacteria bacterium]|nr:peptidase C11 [Acidobacteriota bacterium]
MTKATEKQWTVMVYLAGDNNLDSAGVADLKEMKKIGSSDEVNIIAQFDRSGSNQATKRYYITNKGSLEKNVVANLGETNMGDPNVLKSFIQWGIEKYPAKHYLVVVWNHGAGWDDEDVYRIARRDLKLNVARRGEKVAAARGDGRKSVSIRRIRVVGGQNFHRALFSTSVQKAVTTRGIADDDNAQDFLDNIEMKKLLSAVAKKLGRKIDILGMDACLMSMAEVGYQLRDSVMLTVGSEEIEPGDGWPYDKILAALASKPKMTPQELTVVIVKQYLASYPAHAGVTQAACDLTKSDTIASAVDRLAKVLSNNLSDSSVGTAVVQSRLQAQTYDVTDYIDLYDFCDLLEVNCALSEIRMACQKVKAAIGTDGFVVSSGYKGAAVEHSNGLSIYFPQKHISPLYATLDFTKHTAWGSFLDAYVKSTGRPVPATERGLAAAV